MQGEEVSIAIDLPSGYDQSSGNVTPIPTSGELEDLVGLPANSSTGDDRQTSSTPLKSLLKKQASFDDDDIAFEEDDSPKKVHFSEPAGHGFGEVGGEKVAPPVDDLNITVCSDWI